MFRFTLLSTGTFFALFLMLFSSCNAQDEEAGKAPGLSLEELQKKSISRSGHNYPDPAPDNFTNLRTPDLRSNHRWHLIGSVAK